VTPVKSMGFGGDILPVGLAAIGVVVPVRDEERLLGASLSAVARAISVPELAGVAVRVAVVLDRCADRSADIAGVAAERIGGRGEDHRLVIIEANAGNVGVARHAGFCAVLADLEAYETEGIWLATTDADSRVPASWLTHQAIRRDGGVEAWAGTVNVEDWTDRPATLRASFLHRYRATPAVGGHVHGANMGFSGDAYVRAGGFPPVPTAEDHGLWRRFGDIDARRVHDRTCPVVTSARTHSRAPHGFAGALDALEQQRNQELEDVD
jgi:hypothetical protein